MIRFTAQPCRALAALTSLVLGAGALISTAANAQEREDAVPILEELRVTASRLPRPPASIDARRLRVDQPAFTSQNDLGTALQGQHGVTFTNTGGPGKVSALRVRGEESSRTMVLIDGIELSDVSAPQVTTNVHHLVLAPGISDVDVLAGPQAFFLGGDAGGVVNIRTSEPVDGYGVQVAAEGGSDQHMKISALASAGNSSGGAVVSAQKWRTAGFNSREDDTTLADRDGYDNVTLHARGHWRPTETSVIELVVRDVDATTDFDNCGFPRTDVCEESYEQTSVRLGAVVAGKTLNHRLSASLSEVDRSNFAAGAFSFGAEGDINKYEYSLSGSSKSWDFGGGVELREEEINERDRDQWGVFGETGVTFDNGISAGLGLRFDDNDDFGSHVTGRAHASWLTQLDSNKNMRIRASYGTGFRAPSLAEEAYNEGPFAFAPASETELSEEKSRGIDIGVALESANYSAAITYFNQKIEDRIFFDLSSFAGYLQSDGSAKSTGVTVRGDVELTQSLRLSADYMYNKARQSDQQDRLRRPRNSGRLNLVYHNDVTTLGATVRYVGEVDDELFGLGRSELDDYAVVDLAGSWAVLDDVELFARVTNLFSAEAQDVIGFRSQGTGVYAGVRVNLSGQR